MLKKNIGLFFGSFNPIHTGHLIIANYIVEYTDVSEICFVVSPQNPLKEKNSLIKNSHRINMVNIAIENFQKFSSSDIEFDMPIPSYTVNSLKKFKADYPDKDFTLIIGADNFNCFDKWRDSEKIMDLCKSIFVYPRINNTLSKNKKYPEAEFINAPIIEISSTFIRDAIKQKKNIKYFLDDKVYEYIKKNKLYL